MITGRFDLIIELYIEHPNLLNFLINDLGNVCNISSTESMVTITNFNKWVEERRRQIFLGFFNSLRHQPLRYFQKRSHEGD